MGTPHSGAGLACWAESLAGFIGVFKQTSTEMLKVLKNDSEVLARIQQEFYTMIRARSKQGKEEIAITCFYEELPLQVIGKAVTVGLTVSFLVTCVKKNLGGGLWS
jgi:hypothetical protein